MHDLSPTALLGVASILALASCGEARPPLVPERQAMVAESFRLPNGLEVELASGPCGDEVALALLFAVGPDHDPPARSGAASVVQRLVAARGAAGRVEMGSGHTLYSVVVPADQLESELDDVAAWMRGLALSDEELARARAEVLEEIARRRGGDATLTATSFAAESLQPSRGEGWRVGIAEEVASLDVAQVEAFYAAYGPRNARLVVVGAFDRAEVRARVESVFGALPEGAPAVLRDPGTSTVRGTLVMGEAPSALAVAVAAPAPSEPLFPAFLVLAERLLASSAPEWDAAYDSLTAPETLFVTAPIPPGAPAEPTAAGIRAALAPLLAEPLAPAELAAAERRFGLLLGVNAHKPATCALDARGNAVARARRAQLGLAEVPLRAALAATTQEQLEDAARLFEPRRTAAVIAGGAIR